MGNFFLALNRDSTPRLLPIIIVCLLGVTPGVAQTTSVTAPKPGILVELFTSEGCSSCPPADALLRKLDSQPVVPAAEIVVLGEHVDYWDGIGWRDRFSSRDYTDRQAEYARKFHTSGPYTPEMVVDGRHEFVGNDTRKLEAALVDATHQVKTTVHIDVEAAGEGAVTAKIDTGALPAGKKHADLYVAVADNADETNVGGGENSGRKLEHVAVVRHLQKVAKVGPEGIQKKEVKLRFPNSENPNQMRVIVFLQEPSYGDVVGSAVENLKDVRLTAQATR